MEPLVYIIVPVYNASNYIANAVDSVVRQNYENWRCVLVDDCSTDNSEYVCKRLAESDDRVLFISLEKNSGPAHTRNVGIEFAIKNNADYVAFLDSDDIYETNYLSNMVIKAESDDVDIVWCNYYECNVEAPDNKRNIHHGFPEGTPISQITLLACFVDGRKGLGALWNKLYRTSFIVRNNLRLNEMRVRAEDWEFNLMAFQCSPRVVAISECLYAYIHYPAQSVMSTYRENDYEMFWRSRELVQNMAAKYGLAIDADKQDSGFMYNLISHIMTLKSQNREYAFNRLNYILNDNRYIGFMEKESVKTNGLPMSFMLCYMFLRLKMISLVIVFVRHLG